MDPGTLSEAARLSFESVRRLVFSFWGGRRQFERLEISLVAEYQIEPSSNSGGRGIARCEIQNLSFGGAAVNAAIPEGTLLDLTFRLPNSGARVRALGQVAWTGNERSTCGIDFSRFHKARRHDLNRLSEYLASHMRSPRPEEGAVRPLTSDTRF